MKTRIKYRVWDVENKEFVDDMCLHIDGTLLCDCGAAGYCGDYVVQQFTGLIDKNGKEIYEGDILERIGNGSFCKIVVYWEEKNCRFVIKNQNNLFSDGTCLSDNLVNLTDWTYWIVCGNLFETPELIS